MTYTRSQTTSMTFTLSASRDPLCNGTSPSPLAAEARRSLPNTPNTRRRNRALSEAAFILQKQQAHSTDNLARPLIADFYVSSSNGTANVHHSYEIGKELGFGSFSTVRQGICRISSTNVAVKRLDKTTSNICMLTNELKSLQRVQGHQNVIKLMGTFEDNDHVYITTSLCTNGSLFDFIVNNGAVTEDKAKTWAFELFDAIKHCHKRGVVNRDLKPENILLDEQLRIVIADFGLAAIVEHIDSQNLGTASGSPVFAAPEVYSALKKPYAGGPADMFSIGAVLHCMLAGELPFDIDNFKEEWNSYCPPEHLSEPCRKLLKKLLSFDPSRRPTAREALQSEWLRDTNRSTCSLRMAMHKTT